MNLSGLRRAALTVLGCLAAVYAMAYADLVLRARSAYHEGLKYLEWDRNPSLKKAHFDAEFVREEARLGREFSAGRLSASEIEQKLHLARFERDQRLGESSLKYAYVWFQTAVELFSPPESRWVSLSREEMARTKDLWKRELAAKKIPYQDYMLE